MKKTFCLALIIMSLYACEKDRGPIIISPPVTIPVSFLNDIQPIFDNECIVCHDETHPSLNLKTCCSWDQLLISGASSPYVDLANPSQSLLYQRITGAIAPQMPFGTPLSTTDIDLILKWNLGRSPK